MDPVTIFTVIIPAVLSVASLITGLTPTPKDDAIVAKIRSLISFFSVLKHSDAPGTLKLPLTPHP